MILVKLLMISTHGKLNSKPLIDQKVDKLMNLNMAMKIILRVNMKDNWKNYKIDSKTKDNYSIWKSKDTKMLYRLKIKKYKI